MQQGRRVRMKEQQRLSITDQLQPPFPISSRGVWNERVKLSLGRGRAGQVL